MFLGTATNAALSLTALMAGPPARALQAAYEDVHGVADHSLTAMLWSMLVLVGAAAGLVVIAALWHRHSQANPSRDRPAEP